MRAGAQHYPEQKDIQAAMQQICSILILGMLVCPSRLREKGLVRACTLKRHAIIREDGSEESTLCEALAALTGSCGGASALLSAIVRRFMASSSSSSSSSYCVLQHAHTLCESTSCALSLSTSSPLEIKKCFVPRTPASLWRELHARVYNGYPSEEECFSASATRH